MSNQRFGRAPIQIVNSLENSGLDAQSTNKALIELLKTSLT